MKHMGPYRYLKMVLELPPQFWIVKPFCKYRTPPEKYRKKYFLYDFWTIRSSLGAVPLSGFLVVLSHVIWDLGFSLDMVIDWI